MGSSLDVTQAERAFLAGTRRAVLATMTAAGRPRLVPVCFAVDLDRQPLRIYTPLDDKPKRVTDVHDLARVRDIAANPMVALLVDRWSEDWTALGWLRIDGRADLLEPIGSDAAEHRDAVAALKAKYPQYEAHDLDNRPVIRIAVEGSRSWGSLGG